MDYRTSKKQPPSIIEDNSGCHGHIKKYRLIAHLGKGGFANVYRVQSLDSSQIYACKVVPKSKLVQKEHRRKLISEIKLHRSLQHANIVKFERHFEDKKNVYILLECISNKSLMELSIQRTKFTEHEVRYFLIELINGLKYLHSRCIIHRDLKLGNILLDQHLHIKICDFGLAAKLEFDTERKTTICGTPNYTAPEILNQRKSGEGHSYEVDVWSVGVIMFTLLTGKPPFETKNIKETYRRIKKIKYEFPSDSRQYITDFAKGLIAQIFTKDPTKRPGLVQIIDHPFFKGVPTPTSLPLCVLKRAPKVEELFDNPQQVLALIEQKNNDYNQTFHPSSSNSSSSMRPPLISTGFQNKQRINPTPNHYPQYTHPANANAQQNSYKTTDVNANTNTNTECDHSLQSQQSEKHGAKEEMTMQKEDFLSILKYVDYSKKYGVGYILSNGWTGIYFNDSTKILLDRRRENVIYFDNTESETQCTMTNYPDCLRKKVTLLNHFTAYLWKTNDDNKLEEDARQRLNQLRQSNDANNKENEESKIYVKSTLCDQFCILFKLSNNTVQVNFTDKSRIIIMDTFVFYKDKIGNEDILKLNHLFSGDKKDLKKRCLYTQQLLTKLSHKK